MPLSKRYLKNGRCKVTFRITPKIGRHASRAAVVGEFNAWDPTASPMRKLKDGSFSLTMNLESCRDYQFRYLLDDLIWENEEQPDRFVYSAHGDCDNCVISL